MGGNLVENKKAQIGQFLLSHPQKNDLQDPKVLLLCEHGDYGSFGLEINQSFDQNLLTGELEVLQDLAEHPKISFRKGGDLEPFQMMLVHETSTPKDYMLPLFGKIYLGGDIAFLEEILIDPKCPELLIFFGYKAWLPGQLDAQIENGEYLTTPPHQEDLFSPSYTSIYEKLLHDHHPKFAFSSKMPKDLSLN